MPKKIPATVITGFLGAGKTTLISHLLAHAEGKRIALIINEFGDLGVDGELLKGCGDVECRDEDVVELSNGCICCTVAEDFIPAMTMLIERSKAPEHIVIETSGLALPQPLVRAFNWPEIRTRVTVDSVVTVVDGAAAAAGRFAQDEAAVDRQRALDDNLDHETPLSELFEDQLACADLIVVNKTDLLEGDAAERLVERLSASARDGVRVLPTRMGAAPPEVLLGAGMEAEADMEARAEIRHHPHDEDGDAEHEHGHDEFESFVVALPEIEDPLALEQKIGAAIRAHDVLRLKGFAAIAGKPIRMAVQAVGPRIETYFDRPFAPDEPRETRLVVIGEAGLDKEAIRSALGA